MINNFGRTLRLIFSKKFKLCRKVLVYDVGYADMEYAATIKAFLRKLWTIFDKQRIVGIFYPSMATSLH